MSDQIRFEIAMARRILAREGCESAVAGHVSVRAPGEEAFWVSTFEYFDETVPEGVVKASFDLELLQGDREPSPAISFHAGLYRGRPDVNCVIHTHSHYVMVLATTGRLLGMYNDMAALFLDEQVVHVDDGSATPVDGADMCRELGDKHVIIVKNHGAIFVGDSIETTTVEAFAFERCARIQIEAEMIGGTEHTLAYVQRGKGVYRTYFRPQMWAAAVRRLQRDEPELFIGREDLVVVT